VPLLKHYEKERVCILEEVRMIDEPSIDLSFACTESQSCKQHEQHAWGHSGYPDGQEIVYLELIEAS